LKSLACGSEGIVVRLTKFLTQLGLTQPEIKALLENLDDSAAAAALADRYFDIAMTTLEVNDPS